VIATYKRTLPPNNLGGQGSQNVSPSIFPCLLGQNTGSVKIQQDSFEKLFRDPAGLRYFFNKKFIA